MSLYCSWMSLLFDLTYTFAHLSPVGNAHSNTLLKVVISTGVIFHASAIFDIFICIYICFLLTIVQRPTNKINSLVHFYFAQAQKCMKSTEINVVQKFLFSQ